MLWLKVPLITLPSSRNSDMFSLNCGPFSSTNREEAVDVAAELMLVGKQPACLADLSW